MLFYIAPGVTITFAAAAASHAHADSPRHLPAALAESSYWRGKIMSSAIPDPGTHDADPAFPALRSCQRMNTVGVPG
jgi:hypothetical protein